MPEVVNGQNAASILVGPSWPVLARQVDRGHGSVPVIGNEKAVLPITTTIQLQLQRCLQCALTQQRKAVLQACARVSSWQLWHVHPPQGLTLSVPSCHASFSCHACLHVLHDVLGPVMPMHALHVLQVALQAGSDCMHATLSDGHGSHIELPT